MIQRNGGLDVLVNNAGSTLGEQKFDSFATEDEELIERIVQLNLMGAVWCSRAACGAMSERRRGCIISVSSSVALPGDPKFMAYSTAKGGIISFTRSLARQMAPFGVRVNCIVLRHHQFRQSRAGVFSQTDSTRAAWTGGDLRGCCAVDRLFGIRSGKFYHGPSLAGKRWPDDAVI